MALGSLKSVWLKYNRDQGRGKLDQMYNQHISNTTTTTTTTTATSTTTTTTTTSTTTTASQATPTNEERDQQLQQQRRQMQRQLEAIRAFKQQRKQQQLRQQQQQSRMRLKPWKSVTYNITNTRKPTTKVINNALQVGKEVEGFHNGNEDGFHHVVKRQAVSAAVGATGSIPVSNYISIKSTDAIFDKTIIIR